MVRLQVTARVISEDSYLAHADTGLPAFIPGERRLRITVGKPEEWQIGRLANEVIDRFRKLYNRYVNMA